jgi:hypothetical protein
MTSNVIAALCVASNLPQATKVRECYDNKVLWYLITVLTYQSHVTTLCDIVLQSQPISLDKVCNISYDTPKSTNLPRQSV